MLYRKISSRLLDDVMVQEPTVRSQRIYEGRVINLRVDTVELPEGRTAQREVVEHRGAVCLVALDAQDNVLLVRQYRKPVEETLLEVPAGTLDTQEAPEACARRELREETGFTAAHLELLGTFYTTPGFTSEVMYAYLATGLTSSPLQAEEDEYIEVVCLPFRAALDMVLRGEVRDAKSIATLLLAQEKRRRT